MGGDMLRVLFVEDEAFVRRACVRGLRRYFDVVEAVDGREALDLIETRSAFDVLVTDVQMPRLVRELRERGHPLGTKVLVLTGDVERHAPAFRIWNIHPLGKPVPIGTLRIAVEQAARMGE
jgi:CheY-like chemotaxis protein